MKTNNFLTAAVLLCLCAAPVFADGGPKIGAGGNGVSHGSISKSAVKSHNSSTKSTKSTSGQKTVSDKLADNPKLAAKIEKLLGNGTSAQSACSGFKNVGQCIAAIHVSSNLGVSFSDLKAKMVDPATNSQTGSLGKAIQANADLKGTHS
jgi:hypothetical protein